MKHSPPPPPSKRSSATSEKRLFPLGRQMITSAAQSEVSTLDMLRALQLHAKGDWGDVCPEDRNANERALKTEERLFSVYHTGDGMKFWIITEADRSQTTVLLPSDY